MGNMLLVPPTYTASTVGYQLTQVKDGLRSSKDEATTLTVVRWDDPSLYVGSCWFAVYVTSTPQLACISSPPPPSLREEEGEWLQCCPSKLNAHPPPQAALKPGLSWWVIYSQYFTYSFIVIESSS